MRAPTGGNLSNKNLPQAGRERIITFCLRLSVLAFALGMFFLFCTHACGQPPAVVRVYNAMGTYRDVGSGTLVDPNLVLTCGHLFRDGTGQISILFSDGRTVDGKLAKVDQKWDLAAILIPLTGVTPIEVATQYPEPGESLESSGYGPDGNYRANRGRALGYTREERQKTHETLEMTGASRSGDSGGPIMNQRGELVAVSWGTDGRSVMGTFCGRIKRFLRGISQSDVGFARGVRLPRLSDNRNIADRCICNQPISRGW